jgi:hypothetical protein
MITVTADTSGVRQALRSAGKQAPFAIAKALTQVAKDAQQAVTASMPVKFDRPTPFTMKAMAIKPATKTRLESTVFVKDAQAKYLLMQEKGGTRTPQPGSPIVTPVAQRTNAYGNISRGAIAREKARSDTFATKTGLYRRPGGKGNKKGVAPKLLISFHKRADYQPRFGMQDTVKRSVQSGFKGRLEAALEAALRTSR